MAKKSTVAKVSGLAVAQANTLERKKARLARHLKAHPDDWQSAECFQGSPRKKPFMKGTAPAPVFKLRDGVTGQPLEMPLFANIYAVKAAKA